MPLVPTRTCLNKKGAVYVYECYSIVFNQETLWTFNTAGGDGGKGGGGGGEGVPDDSDDSEELFHLIVTCLDGSECFCLFHPYVLEPNVPPTRTASVIMEALWIARTFEA